jgi:hypothetical protein
MDSSNLLKTSPIETLSAINYIGGRNIIQRNMGGINGLKEIYSTAIIALSLDVI